MRHVEKKYRVDSFDAIKSALVRAHARELPHDVSIHTYAAMPGSGVTKLVEREGQCQVHILTEEDGKFTLKQRIPVKDHEAGVHWLETQGFDKFTIIKMESTDYEYEEGLVGLYTLNDSVLSVILDFPNEKHDEMERVFGLKDAEVITQPYNKYLQGKEV